MKIRAIITGATGMVGEGVLHECLQHPEVEEVLVLGRRSCGITHPKMKEIVHADMYDISPIEDQLKNYNACYYCLGTTSLRKNEAEYREITYTLTMHIATVMSKLNRDMTFCYVSGAATDSSEKSMSMWARVKGKTENDLMKLPFKQVYNFRPGYMQPTKGLKNVNPYYKYVDWMYPFLRLVMPGFVCTLKEVGLAMINVTLRGYERKILELKDIVALARNENDIAPLYKNKEQFLFFGASILISAYFSFLYLNSHIWQLKHVLLRAVQESITIPLVIALIALLIFLIRGLMLRRYSFNFLSLLTVAICLLNIVLEFGSIIRAHIK